MLIIVVSLTLLLGIQQGRSIFHTCVPNSQFLMNGRLCSCNNIGRWSEASCQSIGRRQTCQPGQIIWEECSQCICQENGRLLCTNTQCADVSLKNNTDSKIALNQWCTPFKSYYINCSLCVCPVSGKMSEARCAIDYSCTLKGLLSFETILKTVCVPKVMYLFTCLHCLCSDFGYFVKNRCVETCHVQETVKRCIPRTFYRAECNVCRCPDNGILDNSLCTKSVCDQKVQMGSLETFKNRTMTCTINKFTKPKCYYCECKSDGRINEQACLELDCLKSNDNHYDYVKTVCSPGEMVVSCSQCLCTISGLTNTKYCTKVCSFQAKLQMLDTILREKLDLIDRSVLKEITGYKMCDPDSIILDKGRYCLCPENGNAHFKLCTSIVEYIGTQKPQVPTGVTSTKTYAIDFDAQCEPNTYVEFGCNSCFCTKNGQIDRKWCTHDDCEAKKVIRENHRSKFLPIAAVTGNCITGSIFKVDCNYCICGESGSIKDRSCTKNNCSVDHTKVDNNEFICEPSVYYTVECNTCFCPSDGIKNLERCTKNQCEINFLRTGACMPGQLFSDDCNTCVCPPNGDKNDRVCTNRVCSEADTPWKKIFKLSQSLLGKQVVEETTRNLELCFPGEEFEVGCKVCVCPEMGLREFATCTPMLCGEEKLSSQSPSIPKVDGDRETVSHSRSKRQAAGCAEPPKGPNKNGTFARKRCTPGSVYIIKCQECVCPYMGNINHFCRPMPKGRYCEQAYPLYDFIPMGRRIRKGNVNTPKPETYDLAQVPHNHTFYKCEEPGTVEDHCFICQCEEVRVVVAEHCFKSDHESCLNATASFLTKANRLIFT